VHHSILDGFGTFNLLANWWSLASGKPLCCAVCDERSLNVDPIKVRCLSVISFHSQLLSQFYQK
jgi:hypothetical protein